MLVHSPTSFSTKIWLCCLWSSIPASVSFHLPRGGFSSPTRLSPGAVTPVKDQAVCGSCWSFATTGAMEGALFLKVGAGPSPTGWMGHLEGTCSHSCTVSPSQTGVLTPLSQQVLIDCSWGFGNYACDGGEEWRAYEWIKKHGGIASTESYGTYKGQVRVAPRPRCPSQHLGALKPWWDPPGGVRGSGDEDVTSSPRHQASVVHSTVKAKPQGSSRQFCHRVPQFLFLQNRDKAPPPVRGAMSHPHTPGCPGMEQSCLGTGMWQQNAGNSFPGLWVQSQLPTLCP